ncbi:hypothetical protein PVT67_05220 [Gallaecimonas kandeliae]|uniref:hypothetical protein n=1 Tax=Gallaecimonas kandeliae TaxID=3029055 RepID=UPI00264765CD|nr:hypothetical protein [Gallaecimonas kandeliae]WKE66646.1 hypothetical protein PVT67_05220 [Gallaecimonas kandeliae]
MALQSCYLLVSLLVWVAGLGVRGSQQDQLPALVSRILGSKAAWLAMLLFFSHLLLLAKLKTLAPGTYELATFLAQSPRGAANVYLMLAILPALFVWAAVNADLLAVLSDESPFWDVGERRCAAEAFFIFGLVLLDAWIWI